MNPLHNEFIRQLYMTVLGTLFFMANCAFILIPTALGSTPGRPMAPAISPLSMPMAQESTADPMNPIALLEQEAKQN